MRSLLVLVALVLFAGCIGGPAPAANESSSASPTTTATTAATTTQTPGPFLTKSPTPTPDPPTCAEVGIMPDVTVEKPPDVTVTVTVRRVSDDSKEIIFQHTYEGQDSTTEKIFEDIERPVPDGVRYVVTVETEGRPTKNQTGTPGPPVLRNDVTGVANSPWNQGIRVVVNNDGLYVHSWHFDPPMNFDGAKCY